MTAPLAVFSTYGSAAASPRLRAFRWLDRLGLRGEVHDYLGHGSAGPRDLLAHPLKVAAIERGLRRPQNLARVFIQREASPLSRGRLESRLLRTAELGIYDLDDGFPWDTAGVLRRLAAKPAKAEQAAKAADRTIVANQVLADWATEHCADVRMIPTCIDPSEYVHKSDYELGTPPRIGWIGSRSTLRYVLELAPALVALHRDTDAQLELVGAASGSLGSLEQFTTRIPWSEQAARTRPARWDVAIAPLSPGPFERARSSYKLLEYASAGVPSIGVNWGATGEVVARLGGLGAGSTEEWVALLRDLLAADAAERARLGATQRAAVAKHYSFDVWAGSWLRAVSA